MQVLIAIIAAIPATIFSLATLIQVIKNKNNTASLITKTNEIHELTNGNLAVLKSDLKQALEKVTSLENRIRELQRRKLEGEIRRDKNAKH